LYVAGQYGGLFKVDPSVNVPMAVYGSFSSDVGEFGGLQLIGDTLYFSARDDASGNQFRALNLNDLSVQTLGLPSGVSLTASDVELASIGSKIYFNAFDQTNGRELWVLDVADHSFT